MSAPRRAWRSLGVFWAAVLVVVVGLVGTLHLLGPPPGVVAQAQSPAAEAAPAASTRRVAKALVRQRA
jgi:hypothetical protein